jgi:adenine-specific DNA-methyltransferase
MPAKKKAAKSATPKVIATHTYRDATRKNIPSAEMQPVVDESLKKPIQVAYEQRNPELDPQLVWRGKSDVPLNVPAPPLYIQEKVHPKALIDDLLRQSKRNAEDAGSETPDLFADFNGLPKDAKSTDFYQHDGHWSNRMILGDSLQVMASLAEREGLRGKVQCIYFDPPYGIKFNSNFQWSTTSRDVKDGNKDHITREPEQVKAFRDTWRDGIHSYLTYLRDRLTVARDLLADSGSIFVQIGDENVHRVRAVMDEVFGEDNLCSQITVVKTAGQSAELIAGTADYVLWFAKCREYTKFRTPLVSKGLENDKSGVYRWVKQPDSTVKRLTDDQLAAGFTDQVFRYSSLTSQRPPGSFPVTVCGRAFGPGRGYWKTGEIGMDRLHKADRLARATNSLNYLRFIDDFRAQALGNVWVDTATGNFTDEKIYVVQSGRKLVQRCILMATDPGDLVLDPTCGSGTTATVAEQWGRRWITIDTSRVALALARARIMGARYPFYLLADSRDGQIKEAAITHTAPSLQPAQGNLRHGFVYERVPHITLKSIANNAEIDVIWEKWQAELEPLREQLNAALGTAWQEWEIPRDFPAVASVYDRRTSSGKASDGAKTSDGHRPTLQETEALHAAWWTARIARQQEIDASIAAKADSEFLYDKPYEDKKKVRVAGPFTVESASPHRMLHVDQNDEIIDTWTTLREDPTEYNKQQDFTTVILENLKTAGVQQSARADRITFTSITPFPGKGYVCAEATYTEGDSEDAPTRRAAIFIGPEFGTVSRPDLVEAAREAGDLNADVLIACAFNYDAHSSEFERLGRIPVLKARMNADLHMADDLKNTGKGNLFVIFGEPDISILPAADDKVTVRINGVDVFKPNTGEVVSSGPEGIACWFIDTDYNEESFFVRHAYFLGQNDPYKSLKTTLKAEIDEDAWSTLNSDHSRPFPKPSTGRIAVKVINHLGDEVMKVFSV